MPVSQRQKKSLPLYRALRRARDVTRSGATAVEFALIAPAFFLLLMGTTELCLMIGAQQVIENASFNTSRLVKTGSTNGASQASNVSTILDNELASYGTLIDTSHVSLSTTAYNSFADIQLGLGATSFGTASQIVVYTVTYNWKLFTPLISGIIGTGGYFPLTSTIVVRNEPY